MSGFYLRGAIVEFMPTPLIPIPNIIVFQFNPETMSHAWTQPEPPKAGPNQTTTNPLAVDGNPGESFSFTLSMDAADSIADGGASGALASVTGIASRLAALEMLLFPSSDTEGGLLGTVTAALGGGGGAPKRKVPSSTINTCLFVWGPGRIVPVRLTALTVTERIYDTLLNPVKAEAQVTLRVLTDEELKHNTDTLKDLAKVANTYTHGLRQALAVANLVNSADSVLGMLPI